MNLEQFCRDIKQNYHCLKNKKKTFAFLRYQFELLEWKRQKLKLGAIVFEIKELVIAGITLFEETEIRFIRQDTSQDDNLKIENRLKALGWKWDFKNAIALLVVLVLAFIFFYSCAYVWYCENLPTIAFRDPKANEMIYFSFETTLITSAIGIAKSLLMLNFWFINVLTDFCINYNMLF
jgi:hypothetical protein